MATEPPSSLATLESRSFRAAMVGGIAVVRWVSSSQPDKFPRLTRFIVDGATSARGKVDLVAIVPPINEVPTAELRDAMAEFATATREVIGTTHVVLVGSSGFWQTIVRSILTSLMLIVQKHGHVLVHDSVDKAFARLAALRGLDASEVRRAADAHGLLDRAAHESGRFPKQPAITARDARG